MTPITESAVRDLRFAPPRLWVTHEEDCLCFIKDIPKARGEYGSRNRPFSSLQLQIFGWTFGLNNRVSTESPFSPRCKGMSNVLLRLFGILPALKREAFASNFP
ncbi:MAG: hypothetical protein J07HQX50_01609 [Haloquadratum sp. J07HQX50]|nr:MAG: hypothetical protein J07HQX50_01609 [Haloquadratum sp. J07HQX50]